MEIPKKTAGVAGAVAVAIAATLVPVSFQSAGASTAACGPGCTSPYNESQGTGDVLTASGSSVTMAVASSTSTTQDWAPEQESVVTEAVTAGVVSAKLEMIYGGSLLYEIQYAPGGKASGQCLADTSTNTIPTNTPTTNVALEPCGLTAASLWIADQNTIDESLGYTDLINAGYEGAYSFLADDSNTVSNNTGLTSPFAEPEVLTDSSGKLGLSPLSEVGGVVAATQMWADYLSPAEAEIAKERTGKSS